VQRCPLDDMFSPRDSPCGANFASMAETHTSRNQVHTKCLASERSGNRSAWGRLNRGSMQEVTSITRNRSRSKIHVPDRPTSRLSAAVTAGISDNQRVLSNSIRPPKSTWRVEGLTRSGQSDRVFPKRRLANPCKSPSQSYGIKEIEQYARLYQIVEETRLAKIQSCKVVIPISSIESVQASPE
jgi:hypothetical protein